MEKEDIKGLIAIRNKLINFFNFLDGKHEPIAVVAQKVVAEELVQIIKQVDILLDGKVEFK